MRVILLRPLSPNNPGIVLPPLYSQQPAAQATGCCHGSNMQTWTALRQLSRGREGGREGRRVGQGVAVGGVS